MEPYELVINYLVDPNGGLKQLLTNLLNLVVQLGAYQQTCAIPYERNDQRNAHRNGTRKRTVNYHALKDVACDYVKSRVASGGLTKPP